jgi:glutathione S-transferase
MKLFEFAPTRSIRARWTLQELGVEFEAVSVNLLAGEQRQAEFLAINPAGKVPVLVDGNLVLTESVAIVLYLAEKYRERGLLPDNLDVRAQMTRWLLFTTTELRCGESANIRRFTRRTSGCRARWRWRARTSPRWPKSLTAPWWIANSSLAMSSP